MNSLHVNTHEVCNCDQMNSQVRSPKTYVPEPLRVSGAENQRSIRGVTQDRGRVRKGPHGPDTFYNRYRSRASFSGMLRVLVSAFVCE